ncbi:MAG: sigma 54-interacting transcriptional regulator [Chromatiales bacterium]|jgi:two-component system response regulator GlrR|nr:sigma 54-interacting transcriptional regulator [Chromatiales bacterium]
MSKSKILLVDDDPGLLKLLTIRLRTEGYEVEAVQSGMAALNAATRNHPDLVISDLKMDGMDGIGLLGELQRKWPGLRVVIMTAHGTIPDAVKATQTGAFGFITKPIDKNELLDHINRALQVSGAAADAEDWHAEIITRSAVMEERLSQARMVAANDTRVLLTGESGTGKELLARAIHRASGRADRPFVAINCSAMAEMLLESELFGHEKGAFTGATRRHDGLFQAASGGTLLLDEIGDMPLALQAKLLRVLQEDQVRPVGSAESVAVDVRVISATHRDLKAMMERGEFREDLFYRLNVVNIALPSLGERREDIPLLTEHFLREIAMDTGQERRVYAPEAVEMLVSADWPGNIRQLYNVVRQNATLSSSPVISAEAVKAALGDDSDALASFAEARDEFIRNYLTQILQITSGNVTRAAKLAQRNRTDFYKLLNRHGLEPEAFKRN